MAKFKNVSASEIRAHFTANPNADLAGEACLTGTVRGRLSPKVIAAAEAEGLRYVPKTPKPGAAVEVKVTKVDAKGRKRSKVVEVPMHEARTLLGDGAPSRGRLSAANIEKIGEVLAKA